MSIYRKGRDVVRNGKNATWYVSLRVGGRHFRLCTHTADRIKALAIEATIKQAANGLAVDRVCNAIRNFFDAPLDVESAPKRLLVNLSETVAGLIESERNSRPLAEKSAKARVAVCDRFVAWCRKKVIGESVDEITAHIAYSFIESLEVSNKRKQNIAGDLSACWNMLLRAGLASQNPWKLARPRTNLAEAKHGTAFSRDEVARIIDESRRFAHIDNNGRVSEERVAPRNTWLTTAIYIAVYTGLRQNDVFALEWKDISEDISIIDIIPSKTSRFKRRVVIPIHPVLVTYLRQLERGEGSIVKAPHRPEYAWNLCVKRASIVRGEHELTTFHSLRHTFATWCRESGADKGEQMLLGGWSNVATANRYDHDVSRLTQIVNGLPTV